MTGDNLPTCLCQLETTEGSNQKNSTELVLRGWGQGLVKNYQRVADLILTECNGLSVMLFYGVRIDSTVELHSFAGQT